MINHSQKAKLAHYFKKKNNSELAFIHGSVLTGYRHEESDFDIAVLFKQKPDFNVIADTINELEEIVENNVDLGVLNDASPIFAQQVITKGEILFEKNSSFKARYFLKVYNEYYDLKYYRNIQEKTLLKGAIFAR